MKVLILHGSPQLHGNTAELCKPFMEELRENDAEIRYVTLADKKIGGCLGCYHCQNVEGKYGCVQRDDMDQVVDGIIWADVIILACPIYSFYCPTTMKSVMDRHYGLNKYYGSARGSLWAGKGVGLLLTHGYDVTMGTEAFVTGVRHLCTHSHLRYLGMYSVRHDEDISSFQTEEAKSGARAFARQILQGESQ